MHPIERLRWVARSPEGDLSAAAAEAAEALAAFADDPAGLVIASRRLIERRPEAAPLWWLASRMLCSLEPEFEAISAAAELERDRTPVALAGDLPGGTVAIVGWPDQAAAALRMRARMGGAGRSAGAAADRVVVLASGPGAEASAPDWRRDEAWGCADWLQSHGVDARLVRSGEAEVAARRCVLALLEATAVGPESFVAVSGSAALAAAARAARRPVWLVAGVGRVLPGPLYEALVRRIEADPSYEVVPLTGVDDVTGPAGPVPPARMPRPACPVAAELLRFSG
ncbi:MAG TPA: hypothetical protein VFE55_03420 [Acidimicrobiia bacterium]|nr:hypothetical protein [Acidimicrobiia bacterium]